jgi:hypothetical protein
MSEKFKFYISVAVPNDSGGPPYGTPPYELMYKTYAVAKGGNCTVEPTEGMKGYTEFYVECVGWETEGDVVYEFFDKGAEDTDHYQGKYNTKYWFVRFF